MRREGISLTEAARSENTTTGTVRHYASGGLTQTGRRWKAKPADRLLRFQHAFIIGPDGDPVHAIVETRSSRQASTIGHFNNDLKTYLAARTKEPIRDAAAARLQARHGQRAGLSARLNNGEVIKDPQFFGNVTELRDFAAESSLGDLDYGSSVSARSSK